MKNVVVIGATGLVGGGIAGVLSESGHRVLALGRNRVALDSLETKFPNLRTQFADISDDAAATAAASMAIEALGSIDVVVTSVNPPRGPMKLRNVSTAQFSDYLSRTLVAHFAAARAFIPAIAEEGAYIAIGGGSADFVWQNFGHISTSQAAQRMLLSVLASEYTDRKIAIRNYMINAMVHDGSGKEGVSSAAVGKDVARLLADTAVGGKVVLKFP